MDGLPRKIARKKLIEAGQAKYKNTPIKNLLKDKQQLVKQIKGTDYKKTD